MTKTIEEMAVAYGHKHMGCCDIEDFEAGANAVLEVMEDLLNELYNSYDYDIVVRKIKELKG